MDRIISCNYKSVLSFQFDILCLINPLSQFTFLPMSFEYIKYSFQNMLMPVNKMFCSLQCHERISRFSENMRIKYLL